MKGTKLKRTGKSKLGRFIILTDENWQYLWKTKGKKDIDQRANQVIDDYKRREVEQDV